MGLAMISVPILILSRTYSFSSLFIGMGLAINLQAQGVKAYSLGGGYSETFGLSGSAKQKGLHSKEAYDLLRGYISGAAELVVS